MLPTASTAPIGIDSESVPRLPDVRSGGPGMDFFLLTVSARDLAVDADGYLIAVPCKLLVRPGLNGVEEHRGKVSHDGAILRHQRDGRVIVPDDFACSAFGGQRATSEKDSRGISRPSCTYRIKHLPTEGGPQYYDCWQRYEWQPYPSGSEGEWSHETDADGYMAFLRDLAAWLDPQPHYLRALSDRLRMEGRVIDHTSIKIAGREPATGKPTTKRGPVAS